MSSEDDLLHQTILCLSDTFSSNNTTIIKQSQEKLQSLSTNLFLHIQTLFKILSLDEAQVSQNLKSSSALYLKNLLISQMSKLSSSELLYLVRTLTSSLFSLSPSANTVKNTLMLLLSHFLSCDLFMKNFSLITEMQNSLSLSIESTTHENYIPTATVAIKITNTIVQSKSIPPERIEDAIKQTFPLVDNIFKRVPQFICPTSVDKSFVYLIKEIFEMFYTIFIKAKQWKSEEGKVYLLFQKYGNPAYELICYPFSTNELKEGECIIFFTPDSEMNKAMNLMKAKALQFLTFIVQSVGNKIDSQMLVLVSKEVIKRIMQAIEICVISKIDIIANEASINGENNENAQNGFNSILYNGLVFLNRALIREPIKEIFIPWLKGFLLNQLLPILVPPNEDVTQIQCDGDEYATFFEDLIEGHNIKNYRTAACFLLKKLTSNYIDLDLFVMSFSLQMLEYNIIASEDNKNIAISETEFVLYLDAKKNNSLITSFPPESQIALAIEVLLIFSDNIIDNPQFNRSLKRIFALYFEKMNSITSVLIEDKLCRAYGVFLPEFFKEGVGDNEGILTRCFGYLLELLVTSDQTYPGLSFACADALCNMIDDEKFITLANKLVNAFFGKMSGLIEETQCLLLFDLFSKILSDVYITDQLVLFNFIEKTVNRTKKEIVSQGDSMETVEKCFGIIFAFLSGKNKLQDKTAIDSFHNIILPIISYIKNPKKIAFDDEIIKLINVFITSTNQLGNISSFLISHLQLVCDKNKLISDEVFEFLMTYINIDKTQSNSLETIKYLNSIVDLIIRSHSYNDEDGSTVKYSLLLTAKLFALCAKEASLFLEQLLMSSLRELTKLFTNLQNNMQDESLQMAISCGVACICIAFINYTIDTMNIMKSKNIFDLFFKLMRNTFEFKFYSIVLGKAIILGLCAILLNVEIGKEMEIDKKVDIMKLLFLMINRQKNEACGYAKRLMKRELNCGFVKEDEEESEDESSSSDNDIFEEFEKKKYNNKTGFLDSSEIYDREMIEMAKIGFDEEDEFFKFAKCLQFLGENEKEIMEKFNGELGNDEKRILNEILHVREIQVSYNDSKVFIPRRTVKIKRQQK